MGKKKQWKYTFFPVICSTIINKKVLSCFILSFWDCSLNLTNLLIDIDPPSQVWQSILLISAHYFLTLFFFLKTIYSLKPVLSYSRKIKGIYKYFVLCYNNIKGHPSKRMNFAHWLEVFYKLKYKWYYSRVNPFIYFSNHFNLCQRLSGTQQDKVVKIIKTPTVITKPKPKPISNLWSQHTDNRHDKAYPSKALQRNSIFKYS